MHLYFHADFDGVASAALLLAHFQRSGQPVPGLHPVGGTTVAWREQRLERPAAVVDLRHHPDADLWFDHHQMPAGGEATGRCFWDPAAVSCATVVYRALENHFVPPDEGFVELVAAADRIDGSEFDTPHHVVDCASPWLQLSLVAQSTDAPERIRDIVRWLARQDWRRAPPSGLGEGFREDLAVALERQRQQLLALKETARLDLEGRLLVYERLDYAFHKYLPFAAVPDCALAVGITRDRTLDRLIVCKNRWRPGSVFADLDVGRLCRVHGGGGHFDRGGIPVTDPSRSAELLCRLIADIGDAAAIGCVSTSRLSSHRTYSNQEDR